MYPDDGRNTAMAAGSGLCRPRAQIWVFLTKKRLCEALEFIEKGGPFRSHRAPTQRAYQTWPSARLVASVSAALSAMS